MEMDSTNSSSQSPLSADGQRHVDQDAFMSELVSPRSNTSAGSHEKDKCSNTHDEQGSLPNVQVDDSPLQPCMDKNKESLKVKLLLRRPMNQLVEQGILPPPKTPAAFAGQRVRLERARMGDLLKVKIQQRPARQELVRQHILEDTNARVAPSLAEKQRMLKRARLADSLNDHLIHRPGPLELVRKNILHAPDAQMEQAIKEGVVEFKPTCEGHIPGPQVPNVYLCCEDESSSDLSSPAETPDQSGLQAPGEAVFNYTAKKDVDVQAIVIPCSPLGSVASTLSPMSVVEIAPVPPPPPPLPTTAPVLGRLQIYMQNIQAASDSPAILSSSTHSAVPATSAQICQFPNYTNSTFSISSVGSGVQGHAMAQFPQHSSSSKNRSSRKTGKAKSQPKARTIKFHEYKGPPSAQRGSAQQNSQQEVESSYELLLQQQQLFLQWQLEWQHKYPQIILPAVSKSNSSSDGIQSKSLNNIPLAASLSAFTTTPGTSLTLTRAATLNSIAPVLTSVGVQQLIKPHPIAPAPSPVATSTSTVKTPADTLVLKQTAGTEIKSNQSDGSINGSISENIIVNQRSTSSSSSSELKLNDWKVSDLKAELKHRNLPVSGSKPQLVERLRQSESSLQDESVSTTTPLSNSVKYDLSSGRSNFVVQPSTVVKIEMDESPPSDAMHISESCNNTEILTDSNGNSGGQPVIPTNITCANITPLITSPIGESVNRLNLSASGLLNGHILSGNNYSQSSQKIKVDENVIRDQQKQIEQLQQALKNSQQQLQQMKSSQVGGGQKHRLALQQHLQQKIQQQALQSQLQKLIQLHSIQQQNKISHVSKVIKPVSTMGILKEQASSKKVGKQESVVNSENHVAKTTVGTCPVTADNQAQLSLESSVSGNNSHGNTVHSQHVSNPLVISTKIATLPSEADGEGTVSQNEVEFQQRSGQIINTTSAAACVGANSPTSFQANAAVATENNQDGKLSVLPTVGTDNLDHSWLLKINEVPCSRDEEPVKGVPDFIITLSPKSEEKRLSVNNSQSDLHIIKGEKRCFKSQMVDDVLEILIRNGELPASAAQEPHASTPANKSEEDMCFSSESDGVSSIGGEKVSCSVLNGVVPPPPPFPPATFAVTLPTSMTFSRSLNSSATSMTPNISLCAPLVTSTLDNPLQSPSLPSILDIIQNKTPTSSNFSIPASSCNKAIILKRSNIYVGQKKEQLSDEAADILRISKDLSNFGREHAESIQLSSADQNRRLGLCNSDKFRSHPHLNESIGDDGGNSSFSILLGEVERDLHLVDDMDVVLDDTSPSNFSANKNKKSSELNQMDTLVPMSIDPNHTDSRKNEEYFLNELGILPADLDVPIPMEMDYTDWLENLLPNNCNSSLSMPTSVSQQQHPLHQDSIISHHLNTASHQPVTATDNVRGNVINNNELGGNIEGCNSFFGVSGLDYCSVPSSNQNHMSNDNQACIQRDPLLSSTRTFGYFSAGNLDTGSNLIAGSFGNLDSSDVNSGLVQELKGNSGAPMSPMGDSLLWDFAI